MAIVHRNAEQRSKLRLFLEDSAADIYVQEYKLVYELITCPKNNPYKILILGYHSATLKYAEVANLRRAFPTSHIILYGGKATFETLIPFIGLGAVGYVAAQSELEGLSLCIKAVTSGKLCLGLPTKPVIGMPESSLTAFRHKLSRRENEIADYMLLGMGTSQIGSLINRRISTVSTIKKRIFDKLEITNVLELYRLAN